MECGKANDTPPLQYGKLSDIYGRRALLIVSYSLFAIGWFVSPASPLTLQREIGIRTNLGLTSFIVGIGHTMWEVVLGRVISGSGGSAMSVVTALLITGEYFPPVGYA